MPLLPNINVGSAPNDGTGDTIRNAFIKVNENFQFIEAFFPNTDVANLTANITSTGISTFNTINGGTIGNAGAAFVGATVSAATIGNTGASITGSTVNAATIGNTGAALVGSTVSADTIGNTGTLLTGTLSTGTQPNITSIGSTGSNISIGANVVFNSQSLSNVRSVITETGVTTSATGNINVGFGPANTEINSFHMSGNLTLLFTGTASRGAKKQMFFYNNTGSTRIVTLFNDKNNKGNANISVANGIVASVTFYVTDDTTGNIFGIVANT